MYCIQMYYIQADNTFTKNSQFQVDGQVFVVYNMGTMDHPIGDFYGKVADGQYHVVRFTRAGPNSTIQVDDHKPQLKTPTGIIYIFSQFVKDYVVKYHTISIGIW